MDKPVDVAMKKTIKKVLSVSKKMQYRYDRWALDWYNFPPKSSLKLQSVSKVLLCLNRPRNLREVVLGDGLD